MPSEASESIRKKDTKMRCFYVTQITIKLLKNNKIEKDCPEM
jgi:hypothetical protein